MIEFMCALNCDWVTHLCYCQYAPRIKLLHVLAFYFLLCDLFIFKLMCAPFSIWRNFVSFFSFLYEHFIVRLSWLDGNDDEDDSRVVRCAVVVLSSIARSICEWNMECCFNFDNNSNTISNRFYFRNDCKFNFLPTLMHALALQPESVAYDEHI